MFFYINKFSSGGVGAHDALPVGATIGRPFFDRKKSR